MQTTAQRPDAAPFLTQFAFGFYSVMLTSTVPGLITTVLCKPRSRCVYCPMGTMTQRICRAKAGKEAAGDAKEKAEAQASAFCVL